jgi:outer membrane receptor protein involved in Fe transport
MHLKVMLGRLAITACCTVCVQVVWADETGAGSSTITAEDIRREHPTSVTELLRSRAGVDDSSGTITLRGVQGVAVILNGLPSTLLDVGQLSLDDLARIEIVRGAASARFGANAMGGAIVVTTRKHSATRSSLTLLGSSSSSLGARFGSEWSRDDWQFGLSLKDENERGFLNTTQAPYPNQITVETPSTRSKTAAVRAGLQRDALRLGAELKRADTLAHYGRPNWWEHYVQDTARLNASLVLSPAWTLEWLGGGERYDDPGLMDVGTSTTAAGLLPDRHYLGTGSKADAELALAWQGETGAMRLGTSYRRARDRSELRPYASAINSFSLDAVTLNRALFAHVEQRFDTDVEVALDGRLDRHEYPAIAVFNAQGAVATPALGAVKQSFNPKLTTRWQATEAVSFNASLGTGFVPPTPEQLYYSDISAASWMLGNPQLKPERSSTQDVGVSVQQADDWALSASLFHTEWTDKIGIAILSYGIPIQRQYANIGTVVANGLEFEARRKLAGAWSGNLNYTLNRTRITSNQASPAWVGNSLPDMPLHKLNLALAYETPELAGRIAMRALSAAFTDEANTRYDAQGYRWQKAGYAVFDASLTQRFNSTSLTLALDNLFDRRYASSFFRIGQPRLLRVELGWQM